MEALDMADKNESVTQKGNYFTSHDGLKLFYRVFAPENQNAGGTFLLCLHGFAGHGESFTDLGEFLAGSGITTAAIDHRSHGMSEGERGDVPVFYWFLKDAESVIQQLKEKYSPSKLFLLGESMGGTISIHLSARGDFSEIRKEISGVILCAPGIRPKISFTLTDFLLIPYYLPYVMFSQKSRVIMTDRNYELGCRNPERIREMLEDPLMVKRVSPRFLFALARALGKTTPLAPQISLPLLLLQGTGDKLIDPEGAKTFFEKLSAQDKTLQLFDGAYHGLFSDPERGTVKQTILEWILKRA